jgi:hypothetical protein
MTDKCGSSNLWKEEVMNFSNYSHVIFWEELRISTYLGQDIDCKNMKQQESSVVLEGI